MDSRSTPQISNPDTQVLDYVFLVVALKHNSFLMHARSVIWDETDKHNKTERKPNSSVPIIILLRHQWHFVSNVINIYVLSKLLYQKWIIQLVHNIPFLKLKVTILKNLCIIWSWNLQGVLELSFLLYKRKNKIPLLAKFWIFTHFLWKIPIWFSASHVTDDIVIL